MKTAFISGHIDLTKEEFEKYYSPKLDFALTEGHSFVVGDATGADTMAIEYLMGKTTLIKIYHIGTKPRIDFGLDCKGNFTRHKDKDTAMTNDSDYDILYVRTEEEQRQRIGEKYNPKRLCGTEQNRRRRLK